MTLLVGIDQAVFSTAVSTDALARQRAWRLGLGRGDDSRLLVPPVRQLHSRPPLLRRSRNAYPYLYNNALRRSLFSPVFHLPRSVSLDHLSLSLLSLLLRLSLRHGLIFADLSIVQVSVDNAWIDESYFDYAALDEELLDSCYYSTGVCDLCESSAVSQDVCPSPCRPKRLESCACFCQHGPYSSHVECTQTASFNE